MSRPLFMFRPNLRNAEHRKAWEVLRNVPEGQKSAFLVHAILETVQKENLEAILRRVLREELKSSSTLPCGALSTGGSTCLSLLGSDAGQNAAAASAVRAPGESIPQEMMGFLGSLMDED